MSLLRLINRLWDMLMDRFKLREFLEHPVPRYANLNPLYWFGDVAAVSFVILVVTGVVLALFYQPGVEERVVIQHGQEQLIATKSYQSVYELVYREPFGFVLRNLHRWAAFMMVFATLTHFFAKFLLGAYKRRSGGALWLLGVLLGVLVITQTVLGYILVMDLEAALALQIGLNIFRYLDYMGIPVGGLAAAFMGSLFVTDQVISRIYILHIVLVPGIIAALLGLKIWLILHAGVSPPPIRDRARAEAAASATEPFYPHRFALTMGQFMLQLSFLLLLVAAFPFPIYDPVNGYETWYPGKETPPGVRPPWPVMWYYTLVKAIDPFIAVGLPVLMVLFALVVPLLVRARSNALEERTIWVIIAVIYMAVIGYGTVLGYFIEIPKPLTPFTSVEVPTEDIVPTVGR